MEEELVEGVGRVEVIVGTYEEFLLGYKMTRDKENKKYNLSMSFTNHSQSKSIRAVTTLGKYVISGSADESVNVINMEARREHGSLQEQNGTITCLAGHDANYLFSGCDDGTICIWKKGSWMCEKTLRAHTGGVVDLSVHPSGKLALSVGKDKALKTWNLVKGRCGYVTNLKAVGEAVRWSPEGGHYAVSLNNRVDVYSLQSAKVVYSIPVGKRISCLCFIDESTLVIAGDMESVELHDLKENKKLVEWNCHKIRVKALKYVPELEMLFTASNDGFIKVWKFKKSFTKAPTLVTEFDTTCRITCMDVWLQDTSSSADDDDEDAEMEVDEEVDPEEAGEEDSDDSDDSDEDDEEDSDESEEEEEEEEEMPLSRKRMKVQKPAELPKKKIASVPQSNVKRRKGQSRN